MPHLDVRESARQQMPTSNFFFQSVNHGRQKLQIMTDYGTLGSRDPPTALPCYPNAIINSPLRDESADRGSGEGQKRQIVTDHTYTYEFVATNKQKYRNHPSSTYRPTQRYNDNTLNFSFQYIGWPNVRYKFVPTNDYFGCKVPTRVNFSFVYIHSVSCSIRVLLIRKIGKIRTKPNIK